MYENDEFEYEYGLNATLSHKPIATDRGEPAFFYGMFKTINGGCGFSVMSRMEMEQFAATYSKAYDSEYSPWKTSFEDMAKKTVVKQALRYAPIKTEFQRALSTDETIKSRIDANMAEVENEVIFDMAAA